MTARPGRIWCAAALGLAAVFGLAVPGHGGDLWLAASLRLARPIRQPVPTARLRQTSHPHHNTLPAHRYPLQVHRADGPEGAPRPGGNAAPSARLAGLGGGAFAGGLAVATVLWRRAHSPTGTDAAPIVMSMATHGGAGDGEAGDSFAADWRWMDRAEADLLAARLSADPGLTSLSLEHCRFCPDGARVVAEALERCTTLRRLAVAGSKAPQGVVRAAAGAVARSPFLADLALWDLAADVGDVLLALKETRSVRRLSLRGTLLRNAEALALAIGLEGNSALETLDLGGTEMSADGVSVLAEALKQNSALQQLVLEGNCHTDTAAERLALALRTNAALRSLELGNNNVTNAGAWALAESLEANSGLQTLCLADNDLGDDGALAFARCLAHNTTLRHLDLGGTLVSDGGAWALAIGLAANTSLARLCLSDMAFEETTLQGLRQEGRRVELLHPRKWK
eukprot:EG_transcript_8692